jgi:hypothetical protein
MEFFSFKSSSSSAFLLHLRQNKKINVRAYPDTALAFYFYAKMIKNYNQGLCVECNESIFNPICSSCLAEQLNTWLDEASINAKVRGEIKKFIAKCSQVDLPFQGIRCAICTQNETNLCPYCFTESIYHILKKLEVNRKLLQQFFIYFNYDFEHTGYSKDFESKF